MSDILNISTEKIEVLEREFMKLPQVPCPVTHRFGTGLYIREVKIPAGSYAIGHHQNFEHMNILLQGRVSIRNDDGSFSELKAPMIFIAKPGRKIGYIHEDMTWLNIYATHETDVEKLEKRYLTKSSSWISSAMSSKKVLELSNHINQEDFEAAIKELGFTKEQVREQSENKTDVTDLPSGGYKFKLARSNIEGTGVFATADIGPGEIIAPARISDKRTVIGRFTNHSKSPNAKMVRGAETDINLIATKKIEGCRGGIDGEEITINYREAYALTIEIGKAELCPVLLLP